MRREKKTAADFVLWKCVPSETNRDTLADTASSHGASYIAGVLQLPSTLQNDAVVPGNRNTMPAFQMQRVVDGNGESMMVPVWQSEFGAGRPGWHIECSAAAVYAWV